MRKRGRGPFTDDEWDFILRLWQYVEEFDQLADRVIDKLAQRVRGLPHRAQRPFTDTEAWLIFERSGVLRHYQEQLAERVQRLQLAQEEEARDKAGSGSDLLLTVIAP